jgi:hypothetical protein
MLIIVTDEMDTKNVENLFLLCRLFSFLIDCEKERRED